MFRSLVFLMVLAMSSPFAQVANEIGRPTFTPGNKFTFTETTYYSGAPIRTFTLTFKGTVDGTGELIFTEKNEGKPPYDLIYSPDANFVRGSRSKRPEFTPSTLVLSFPMKVGSEWKGEFVQNLSNLPEMTRQRRTSVRSYESINLPAGTFDAFKLVSQNWLMNTPGVTRPADEQYYYCPKVGLVCAYESRQFDRKRQLIAVER